MRRARGGGRAGRTAVLLGMLAMLSCSGQTEHDRSSAGGGQTPGSPSNGPAGSGSGGSTPPASTPPPVSIPPAPAPGSSGSGGSSAGGGAAGSPAGAGGSTGNPGQGAADAGASADAAPPMPPAAPPPPLCALELIPRSPQRWRELPAGEGYKLRLEARASGSMVPAKPTWRWQVTHNNVRDVPTVVADGDPAVREFATDLPGRYDVVAEIVGVTPACTATGAAIAIVPNQAVTRFRIRATPPVSRNLATLEVDVPVNAGVPASKVLELGSGRTIEVRAQTGAGAAVPSYFVSVTARASADRFEGYIQGARAEVFQARVDVSHENHYDVMVVPDSKTDGVLAPAKLYAGLTPYDFFPATLFALDPGVRIAGQVQQGAAGAALAGARIRLRAGVLPSTVGESDATGNFELRARGGRFEVRVLPPAASGLPEALLPESTGLAVQDGVDLPLSFRYAALPSGQLDLKVLGPDGAVPGRPVDVLLESVPGALPDVGAFTLAGGQSTTAIGSVRILRTTAAGTMRFDRLPRTRYRATVIPPEGLPGDPAVTTVEFALEGEAALQTVTLARRTRILGRLLPAEAARELTVRGLDVGTDGVRRATTAVVDAEGRYQLPVDPGRVYRLSVEPALQRRMPRIPLIPVRARSTDVTDEQRLPAGLPVTGRALDASNSVAVNQGMPGVLIQIFCLGSAPDCLDPANPDISNTPPIDETVSAGDGSYQLFVPDPGLR